MLFRILLYEPMENNPDYHVKFMHQFTREQTGFFVVTILYFVISIFGRGVFWERYDAVQLYAAILLLPAAFFIHTRFLIKFAIHKNRNILYGVVIVLGGLLAILLPDIISLIIAGSGGQFNKLWVVYSIAIASSWIYVTTRDWYRNNDIIEKLEKEKIGAEMKFLKSQINPHFLFNTLNSLYALALKEGAQITGDGIIQLSNLMRYTLHDTSAERILLEKEKQFLKTYVTLQNLRLPEEEQVIFYDNVEKSDNKASLPPLLLLPLVENVFKHQINSTDMKAEITLDLDERMLRLTTKNRFAEDIVPQDLSGVGIANLKARLNLLFPNTYTLRNQRENAVFFSELIIPLQK